MAKLQDGNAFCNDTSIYLQMVGALIVVHPACPSLASLTIMDVKYPTNKLTTLKRRNQSWFRLCSFWASYPQQAGSAACFNSDCLATCSLAVSHETKDKQLLTRFILYYTGIKPLQCSPYRKSKMSSYCNGIL